MRALKILALALMPVVVLTACDQKKSDTATAGAAGAYDTSADSNKRFLADYAARKGVTKLPDECRRRLRHRSGHRYARPGASDRAAVAAAAAAQSRNRGRDRA